MIHFVRVYLHTVEMIGAADSDVHWHNITDVNNAHGGVGYIHMRGDAHFASAAKGRYCEIVRDISSGRVRRPPSFTQLCPRRMH